MVSLLAGAVLALQLTPPPPADPAPAYAPQADLERREADAKKECAAGRWERGGEILAELYAGTGDIDYVFNQGRCYQQNNRPDEAIARFREFLRRADAKPPEARKEAEDFIAELEAEKRRTRDGGRVAPAWMRPAAIATGALGVVGIGFGIVMSTRVSAAEDETQAMFNNGGIVAAEVLNERAASAKRFQNAQWVGYGIGAAALAACATILVLETRAGSVPLERAARGPRLVVAPVLAGGMFGDMVGATTHVRF